MLFKRFETICACKKNSLKNVFKISLNKLKRTTHIMFEKVCPSPPMTLSASNSFTDHKTFV